jgi:hypothetical protein
VQQNCGLWQCMERVLQRTLADSGRSRNQRAVGDGLGDRGKDARTGDHLRGIDGGLCRLERHAVLIHHAQVTEAEVMHRPRDCADIVRIACAHQDHGHTRKRDTHASILSSKAKRPEDPGRLFAKQRQLVVPVSVNLLADVVLLVVHLRPLLRIQVTSVGLAVGVYLLVNVRLAVLKVLRLARR